MIIFRENHSLNVFGQLNCLRASATADVQHQKPAGGGCAPSQGSRRQQNTQRSSCRDIISGPVAWQRAVEDLVEELHLLSFVHSPRRNPESARYRIVDHSAQILAIMGTGPLPDLL